VRILFTLNYVGIDNREEWTDGLHPLQLWFGVKDFVAEALDLDKTVLKTIEEAAEDWKVNDIKGLLGRCSFKAEMLHRKVAFLSGGEKARFALCNSL